MGSRPRFLSHYNLAQQQRSKFVDPLDDVMRRTCGTLFCSWKSNQSTRPALFKSDAPGSLRGFSVGAGLGAIILSVC